MPDSFDEPLIRLSAVLGRVKVFAHSIAFAMLREFDFARALTDWLRKLRMLKANCWALDRFVASEFNRPNRAAGALENCSVWLLRSIYKIDAAIESLQVANTPDIRQRADRYATRTALMTIYEVLRDIHSVHDDLESAQIELGIAADDRGFEGVLNKNQPLYEPPGIRFQDEFEEALAEAHDALKLDPLKLCMATRHLATAYGYAVAIGADYLLQEAYFQQVVSLHKEAVEVTEELLNSGKFSSVSRTLTLACRNANQCRLDRLLDKREPGMTPSRLAERARPSAFHHELCVEIGTDLPRLTLHAVPRVLIFGPDDWTAPIERQLSDDFAVSATAIIPEEFWSQERSVDLLIISDEASLDQLNRDGFRDRVARVLCVGHPEERPRQLPDSWRYLSEPIERIDRQAVQVYLTGRVDDEWCRQKLWTRRMEALATLTSEWLFESFLVPRLSDGSRYESMPEVPSLWTLDRLRELLTQRLPEGPKGRCKAPAPPTFRWPEKNDDQWKKSRLLVDQVRQSVEYQLRRNPLTRDYGLTSAIWNPKSSEGESLVLALNFAVDDVKRLLQD